MAEDFLEKLKRGSLWSLVAQIIGSASGFLVFVPLAKLLSVEALGAYLLFLAILRFASLFVKMGMENSLQKVLGIAAEKADWKIVRAYVRTTVVTLAFASMVITVVLYFFWDWITGPLLNVPSLTGLFVLVLIAVPLRAIEDLGSAFFRAVHEPRIGVFLESVPRQCLLLLAFCWLQLQLGKISFNTVILFYLGASILSVFLISLLIMGWLRHRSVTTSSYQITEVNTFEFWKLSFPMMIHGGAAILLSTSDIWILGIFTTTKEVAVYGAVVRSTIIIVFALNMVNRVIPPILAFLHENGDRDGLETLLRNAASWSVFIVVPLLVLFLFWGDLVLALVFGEQFRLGAFVLGVLAVAHSVNALSGSPGMLLQMTGHHYLLMRLTIFWAVFNIIADVIAVKFYAMDGVGVVTAISIIGLNLSMVYFAKSKLKVKTWAKVPALVNKII